jgi:biotin carboxylase
VTKGNDHVAEAKTVLFLSSAYKGDEFIRAVKRQGCRVLLMTEESLRHEPWPRDSIDELLLVPDLRRYQDIIHTVAYMCRGWTIDLVLPIDEFEVELAAFLREHLRLPGPRISVVRQYRDKLIMRELAAQNGILVPEFIQILNYDRLREFMGHVPPPWVLKPRTEAGSMGVMKVNDSEQVWRKLDELGDRQSFYLLEQYVPGSVYHVDSLVVNKKIAFTNAHQYFKPPMDVYQGGGVFATRTVPRNSDDAKALKQVNEQVVAALGIVNGAAHIEFIKADGRFYFLEAAGRVGGAFISDLVEHASGINLWREWGNLEVALLRGEKYKLPKARQDHGGLLVTLAQQEHPDMSGYNDPEIVWKADKPYHAGLIVVSKDATRVEELLTQYIERFARDFMAVAAPMGVTRTGQTG